jgi:hypothetical protein
MRRLVLTLALLLAVFPAVARHADAFETWCFDDPVVDINGQRVNIDIGVQGDPAHVSDSVRRAEVVIAVPKEVRTRLVSTTNQYFQEKVRFTTSDARWSPGQPVPVTVTVQFEATTTLPTAMVVTMDGTTITRSSGTTSSGMSARFVVR